MLVENVEDIKKHYLFILSRLLGEDMVLNKETVSALLGCVDREVKPKNIPNLSGN